MSGPLIRYDLLVQDALLGVVRKVLADAARDGTPGDHHFFVSFRTNAPGVQLSQRMKAKYPEEITIVLQHQFWDLTVNDNRFEVNLSFNNVPERLIVPFEAVTGFEDPTAPFGLKFEPRQPTEASTAVAPALATVADAPPPAKAKTAPKPAKQDPKPEKEKAEKADKPDKAAVARKVEAESDAKESQQGKVISIDAFRKKT